MIRMDITDINTSNEFEPSEDLLELADTFSKNWEKLNYGAFCSNDKKYHIDYVKEIKYPVETIARIGHTSKIINISKDDLISINATPNYVFFLILWCIVDLEIKNRLISDEITINYYKKTNRSIRDLYLGFIATGMKKRSYCTHDTERLQRFTQLTKDYANNI